MVELRGVFSGNQQAISIAVLGLFHEEIRVDLDIFFLVLRD